MLMLINSYALSLSLLTHTHTGQQLQIWDTAGMEQFRNALVTKYYRNADGIVLVFDISKRESFEGLDSWISEVKQYCEHGTEKLKMVLIGNKVDRHHQRKVHDACVHVHTDVCVCVCRCVHVHYKVMTFVRTGEYVSCQESIDISMQHQICCMHHTCCVFVLVCRGRYPVFGKSVDNDPLPIHLLGTGIYPN